MKRYLLIIIGALGPELPWSRFSKISSTEPQPVADGVYGNNHRPFRCLLGHGREYGVGVTEMI